MYLFMDRFVLLSTHKYTFMLWILLSNRGYWGWAKSKPCVPLVNVRSSHPFGFWCSVQYIIFLASASVCVEFVFSSVHLIYCFGFECARQNLHIYTDLSVRCRHHPQTDMLWIPKWNQNNDERPCKDHQYAVNTFRRDRHRFVVLQRTIVSEFYVSVQLVCYKPQPDGCSSCTSVGQYNRSLPYDCQKSLSLLNYQRQSMGHWTNWNINGKRNSHQGRPIEVDRTWGAGKTTAYWCDRNIYRKATHL